MSVDAIQHAARRELRARAARELALGVLPWVALVVAARVLTSVLDLAPIDNPLLTGVLAANVFLLGFLLAGTLSDFKDAERLPGDLAAALDSIADECWIVERRQDNAVAAGCVAATRDVATGVLDWLAGRGTEQDAVDSLRGLNYHFAELEDAGLQITFLNRLKLEQANARRALLRMATIRKTSFVSAGYLVAQAAAAMLICGLLFTDIEPLGEAVFYAGVIAFLLLYMHRLLRDLDNPFEYSAGTQGSADVSVEVLERVEARLRGDAKALAAPSPASATS